MRSFFINFVKLTAITSLITVPVYTYVVPAIPSAIRYEVAILFGVLIGTLFTLSLLFLIISYCADVFAKEEKESRKRQQKLEEDRQLRVGYELQKIPGTSSYTKDYGYTAKAQEYARLGLLTQKGSYQKWASGKYRGIERKRFPNPVEVKAVIDLTKSYSISRRKVYRDLDHDGPNVAFLIESYDGESFYYACSYFFDEKDSDLLY